MHLLEVLDLPCPLASDDLGGSWDTMIDELVWPLVADPTKQREVVDGMTRDRAWVLLGWAGRACSRAVRRRSTELLRGALAVFAMVDGCLDRRDVLVIASLARRGCALIGVDFERLLPHGSGDDGSDSAWLAHTSPLLPTNYVEVGTGESFEFHLKPAEFDPVALQERLRDRGTDSGA